MVSLEPTCPNETMFTVSHLIYKVNNLEKIESFTGILSGLSNCFLFNKATPSNYVIATFSEDTQVTFLLTIFISTTFIFTCDFKVNSCCNAISCMYASICRKSKAFKVLKESPSQYPLLIQTRKIFFQNVLAFNDASYRYHYFRYFIYSNCMRGHVCTTCNSILFS